MTNYTVKTDAYVETNTAEAGTVGFTFKAGTVTPKDAAESAALDQLVDAGIASVGNDSGFRKTSTKFVEPSTTDTPSEV
ncbi:hypothetical protein UFOVP1608_24 [uncultured Caudovirales phage]|uniref:Uncharacterized protein n=1 Tax=uncultured Caudovirales phage TaxID=2100421 RepID=A0A6J5SST7_9CAUD|nr:hypothetical protein UFOVP1608_24 [uncultured Caudovirales phage]